MSHCKLWASHFFFNFKQALCSMEYERVLMQDKIENYPKLRLNIVCWHNSAKTLYFKIPQNDIWRRHADQLSNRSMNTHSCAPSFICGLQLE